MQLRTRPTRANPTLSPIEPRRRFPHVTLTRGRAGLTAMLTVLAIGACSQGDPPVADGGTDGGGGDEGDGGGDGACVVPDTECDIVNTEAHYAPQIVGCFGAAVDLPGTEGDPFSFVKPGPVTSTDPAQVGHWTTIIDNEMHLPIHAIHRPTGKFLVFGAHEQGGFTADKGVWVPPEPCVDPFGAGIESCDVTFDLDPTVPGPQSHWHVYAGDPDMTEYNLFCAGHVNLPPEDPQEFFYPRTLTVGGSVPNDPNQGLPGAFVFWEQLPDTVPTVVGDYDWTEVADLAFYRWYPTASVLADGRPTATGGSFDNSNQWPSCSVDGVTEMTGAECSCESVPGDFWHELQACADDGFCNHEVALPDDAPMGVHCDLVADATPGLDVGDRTMVTNPPALAPDDDIIEWTTYPTGVWGTYPQNFVVPDLPHLGQSHLGGTYIKVGSETNFTMGSGAMLWDPAEPFTDVVEFGGISCAKGSSAVMYASDKILKFGGPNGAEPCLSTRISEVFDLSSECPHFRPTGPTAVPKHYSAGVVLPNGTVLATGGTVHNDNLGDADTDFDCGGTWPSDGDETVLAISTTELFQPSSDPEPALAGEWCRLADLPFDSPYRGYHSQSFLLPDGRVYLGAGGAQGGTVEDHFDYALFAPPYLFWGPRPTVTIDPLYTINGIGSMVAGGSPIVLNDTGTAPISRVTLIKLASSTHQFDQEQRLVELEFSIEPDGVHVTPPPSTCYATPGYYMLFAISDAGVPSIAQYVAVTGTCAEANESVVAPISQQPPPKVINDVLADGSSGLRASCGPTGSQLSFEHFGRELLDLCTAAGACLGDASIDLEVRLRSSTGIGSAVPGELLDTARVEFHDGVPSFSGDGLTLDVAGYADFGQSDLGPGDHVLEICGQAFGGQWCTDQPLRIDAVLGIDGLSEVTAARIERADLALWELDPGPGRTLGDDEVVEIALPEGFTFPFYGVDHDTIWVGANGGIRLAPGPISPSNGALPQVEAPQIAVFWDDLDPSAGGTIRTYFDGHRMVVAWEGVPITSGGTVSAQVHLLANGRIEMHYPNVDDGPFAYGGSATIGIQDGNQALTLSVDDTTLLSSGDAFAFDATDCIASRSRLPDAMTCHDTPATAPLDVAICGGFGQVHLELPEVPTMCEPHPDARVRGSVWRGDERQPVASDGSIPVHVGNYEARWTTRTPGPGRFGRTWSQTGQTAIQPLRVRESDEPNVCCEPDQTLLVLTPGIDDTDVGGNSAVCAVAQGGDDIIQAHGFADTLLGQQGDDTLQGGGGNDRLIGGEGADRLRGGSGADILVGGPDDDQLAGDDDGDGLWGGRGNDLLLGGGGGDRLLPGDGRDTTNAGEGNDDVIILASCEIVAGETLDGGNGNDTLWLPEGMTVADLQALGATVTGFENIQTLSPGSWGTAECEL